MTEHAKAWRSSRRLKYNRMWWAALLVFKYIVPQRLKRELIVPVWTKIQDLSCLPSGALHFLWVLECSQESGASPELGLTLGVKFTLKVLQGGDNFVTHALISFILSQHSGRNPGREKKTPENVPLQ